MRDCLGFSHRLTRRAGANSSLTFTAYCLWQLTFPFTRLDLVKKTFTNPPPDRKWTLLDTQEKRFAIRLIREILFFFLFGSEFLNKFSWTMNSGCGRGIFIFLRTKWARMVSRKMDLLNFSKRIYGRDVIISLFRQRVEVWSEVFLLVSQYFRSMRPEVFLIAARRERTTRRRNRIPVLYSFFRVEVFAYLFKTWLKLITKC